jgi:hypothetical protein
MTTRSSSKKILFSQDALVCGEAFQRLADELIPRIEAVEEGSKIAMSNEMGDVVACATNLAFAVELYLKALLTQLDMPVTMTHDLRKLYDGIPQHVRAIIESVYDERLPVEWAGHRACFSMAKGPIDTPQWEDYSKLSRKLPDLLSRSRDIFQCWRYVFEFTEPEDSLYQVHVFEYGLLRTAAEALRVEVTVRLQGPRDIPASSPVPGSPLG